MGRNGAGKSTLLRLLKGLAEPTRGRIERAGDVALLLQNPGDYLIHEHAREEAGEDGAGRRRARGPRATPTRATSPAASASGSRWRWCWPPARLRRSCCSTSPRAAWTARTSAALVARIDEPRGRRRRRDGRHPRHRVRRGLRRPGGAHGPGRRDRRRLAGRGAGGRLALLHRGRARAGRRRRRADRPRTGPGRSGGSWSRELAAGVHRHPGAGARWRGSPGTSARAARPDASRSWRRWPRWRWWAGWRSRPSPT